MLRLEGALPLRAFAHAIPIASRSENMMATGLTAAAQDYTHYNPHAWQLKGVATCRVAWRHMVQRAPSPLAVFAALLVLEDAIHPCMYSSWWWQSARRPRRPYHALQAATGDHKEGVLAVRLHWLSWALAHLHQTPWK